MQDLRMQKVKKRPIGLYAVASLLAALVFGFYAERTIGYFERIAEPSRAIRLLWTYEPNSFIINEMPPEAEAAGLQKGDLLIGVEGQPANVLHDFSRALRQKRAGETLTIQVRRANLAAPVSLAIPLAQAAIPSWQDRVAQLVLEHTMPWICILLGYWVVMVRPRDRRAWFLFLLMLGFSGISSGAPGFSFVAHWPPTLGFLAIALRSFSSGTWPVWMLLFALVFPGTFPWLRRWWPALAVYITPIFSHAIWNALAAAAAHAGPRAISGPPQWLDGLTFWMEALCIGGFFACIGYRMGTTQEPDARRRLRLLYASATISLTPSFIIMLVSAATNVPFTSLPTFIWLPSLLLITLLPLSLAYIILVERALDVRVAIRQGVQYALAKGFLTLLRFGLIVFVVVASVRMTDDPWGNLPQFLLVISLTVAAVIAIRLGADRMRVWVDRRFFREAYNTEVVLTTLAAQVTELHSEREVLESVCETIATSLHVETVGAFLFLAGMKGSTTEAELAYCTAAGADMQEVRRIEIPGSLTAVDRPPIPAPLAARGVELVVQVPARKGLLGLLAFGPKRSEAAYSATDLRLLDTVARQAGLAIENTRLAETVAHQLALKELLDRELQIARSIQQRLLPARLPEVEGFEFAGICEPAQSVGGDYFDFIALPGERVAFAIGDVSGKGIPAALLMASLQASLRGLLAWDPVGDSASAPDTAKLMAKLNTLIYDVTPASRFVTLLLGILDTRTGEISLANAGHCPALLARQNGAPMRELLRSQARGPALGLRRTAAYRTETLQLRSGDLLVAYTDGVSEAMNTRNEEFGEESVETFTLGLNGAPAISAIERLREQVHRFAGDAPQHDDLTAIAVARAPRTPASGSLA